MPSLRRSASTPSVVRSSPYPSRSALRNGTGSAARSGGRPKRSGGSETSSRRVLADIEWWKVQAAQIPEQLENEDDEQAELDLAAIARLPLVLAHVERPTTPDNQGSPEPMSPSGVSSSIRKQVASSMYLTSMIRTWLQVPSRPCLLGPIHPSVAEVTSWSRPGLPSSPPRMPRKTLLSLRVSSRPRRRVSTP